ncbi:aromatic ring-hydroxylating oxygenase subunit alpha [Jatrophihabitans lederbergiae]|uniref:Aromatic ring-hydroxylating dioxygenase subunit alpha n=1 Tax=Jatrophihabitans lederbergiae TaxID=3075547 RepID=A0ABU2JB58_9ACTN|nr:aromatic ring-hydroxylating dioxygenase subunit alpha [Jatrophihabitans sp. DSM 44399]MDT0262232.1 aromatic ring-hydroxylating dioxygenase subunit alpha [Jatrophihabitans sp. DSM 44399]
MNHDEQVSILKRLLCLREEKRDDKMLDDVVTIPVTKYTDAELFRQELASTFSAFPLVVGNVATLREPGTFVRSDWDDFPYVVVRGADGVLRGFFNQCRHRGAELTAERSGTTKAFVCPFHGWVYGLDGTLKGITRSRDFPGLDTCAHGLVELPVAEAGGLVWIGRTPGTPLDVRSFLGDFYQDLVDFGVESLVQYKKTKVVKNANWKLLIQTYLEGYHVPHLHRHTLSAAFRKGAIAHDESGPHIRLSAARTNVEDVHLKPEDEWQILDYASVYYSFFPNTFFIMHPDYVSINIFYPLSPNQSIWTHEMLYRAEDFVGPAGQAALEKRFVFTNDTVFGDEDFAIAEDIQKNLVRGANTHHTLGLAEGLLAMFQDNIDQRLDRSSTERTLAGDA